MIYLSRTTGQRVSVRPFVIATITVNGAGRKTKPTCLFLLGREKLIVIPQISRSSVTKKTFAGGAFTPHGIADGRRRQSNAFPMSVWMNWNWSGKLHSSRFDCTVYID